MLGSWDFVTSSCLQAGHKITPNMTIAKTIQWPSVYFTIPVHGSLALKIKYFKLQGGKSRNTSNSCFTFQGGQNKLHCPFLELII